jgi:hypothetical protein
MRLVSPARYRLALEGTARRSDPEVSEELVLRQALTSPSLLAHGSKYKRHAAP